jgi:hypothetical protein
VHAVETSNRKLHRPAAIVASPLQAFAQEALISIGGPFEGEAKSLNERERPFQHRSIKSGLTNTAS